MAFPSTFVDLQNDVIQRLRLDATADLAKVKDWINQVYAQVCVETEANVTVATMALTAGTSSYTLSSSIERIKGMFVTPVGGQASQPLLPITLDELIKRRSASNAATATSGSVTHYALLGLSEFEVWPTPASADTITVYYSALPTALSADADVPILHEPWASKLLFNGAAAEAADYKGDPAENDYRAIFEDQLRRYRTHLSLKGPRPNQFQVVSSSPFPLHDPSTDVRDWD